MPHNSITRLRLKSIFTAPAFVRETRAISEQLRAAPEGVYNSALLYNRAGEPAGIYNKVHCRGHDRKFVAGGDLPVFGSDFGLFGVVICADRRWPETVRALALRGARIIFNPTYGNYGEMIAFPIERGPFADVTFVTRRSAGESKPHDVHRLRGR